MALRVVSMEELKLEVLFEPERSGDSVVAVCRASTGEQVGVADGRDLHARLHTIGSSLVGHPATKQLTEIGEHLRRLLTPGTCWGSADWPGLVDRIRARPGSAGSQTVILRAVTERVFCCKRARHGGTWPTGQVPWDAAPSREAGFSAA